MSIDRAVLFRLATSDRWERLVRSTPRGADMAWRAASRYVAGTTVSDAVRTAREIAERGVAASVDQFGELVGDVSVADRVADGYLRLAGEVAALPGDVWLAVDLSHLGLDADRRRCADHLARIAESLPAGRRIQVGAEDHARGDAVRDCVLEVAGRGFADRLGATVQANLLRTEHDLPRLLDAGVHLRLVKGAYVEPSDRARPYGEPTDIEFVRLAHRTAGAGVPFSLATHDGVLREALLSALGSVPVEQLLGVRPEAVDELRARGVPVRVYVPFGENWFRYWMRRLAESRGA